MIEVRNKSFDERLQIAQQIWEKMLNYIVNYRKPPYFLILHWDHGSVSNVLFRPIAIGNLLNVLDYEFFIKLFVFDDRTIGIEFDEKEGRIIIDFEWDEPDIDDYVEEV